jgi:hypothetical protein
MGWMDDRRVIFRFPSEKRDLSSFQKRPNWLGSLPILGVKRPGPEPDHLDPLNVEVKNEGSCASLSALFIHTVNGHDFTYALIVLFVCAGNCGRVS